MYIIWLFCASVFFWCEESFCICSFVRVCYLFEMAKVIFWSEENFAFVHSFVFLIYLKCLKLHFPIFITFLIDKKS